MITKITFWCFKCDYKNLAEIVKSKVHPQHSGLYSEEVEKNSRSRQFYGILPNYSYLARRMSPSSLHTIQSNQLFRRKIGRNSFVVRGGIFLLNLSAPLPFDSQVLSKNGLMNVKKQHSKKFWKSHQNHRILFMGCDFWLLVAIFWTLVKLRLNLLWVI